MACANKHIYKGYALMANLITVFRIILSCALPWFEAGSKGFAAVYLLAGLTDMVDGPVARMTGTESESGSRLDTAADICFFVAAAFKVFPVISIPRWLFVWIIIIALLKAAGIAYGMIRNGRLTPIHSKANKLTGLLMFIFPFTLTFIPENYSVAFICALATIAAIHELLKIRVLGRNKRK